MTITFSWEIFEKKKKLEIGPFKKLAKAFFSMKDINLIFYTNFLDIKAYFLKYISNQL